MITKHCPKCNSTKILYEFDVHTGKYKGNIECEKCRHKTDKSKLIIRVWEEAKEDLQFLEQVMIGLVRIKQKNVSLDWARDIITMKIIELKKNLDDAKSADSEVKE